LESEFAEALRPLMEVADEKEQIDLTVQTLDFISKVFAARDKKLRLEEVNKALKPIFEERTKNMIPTIFDEARAEGRAEGEMKGKVEGRVEGERKARADEIIRVLSRRLEVPPKSIQQKIRSIRNIDKLDELVEFAWACVSVNEFVTALN
jgi:F0F1-type ATP synthase delta subunit